MGRWRLIANVQIDAARANSAVAIRLQIKVGDKRVIHTLCQGYYNVTLTGASIAEFEVTNPEGEILNTIISSVHAGTTSLNFLSNYSSWGDSRYFIERIG